MIKNNLKEVYDTIAEKYYLSRNKHRNDGKIIADEILKSGKKELDILEFGSGGGRCIKYLNENLKGIKINYIGVDISKELLNYAKKDNKKNEFICDDICNYIKDIKQESFDYILGIASFQHIENNNKRTYLMKNFYKALKYGGKIIMTNRSFSDWFNKKYKKEITQSILKTVYTFGNHKRNDLMIPRKHNGKTLYRFYHIFIKKELIQLHKENYFSIKLITYLNKNGEIITNRKQSENIISIGEKST